MRTPLCALVCASLALSQTTPQQPAEPAPSGQGQEQTQQATEPLKQTLVVTGAPDPVPLEEADRSVSVLPVRGRNLMFNTFIDVLRLDPSLDLRQRGVNGMQADVSLRGATFGQVLVLVNGRRMNDPQTGHHHMDLAVPLEAIDRMEVLRGAGSTLYGADASGGVIHLITKPAETGEIRLQSGLGNFGVNQQRVSMTGIRGRLSQMVSFQRDFSSGFMPNRDFRNLTGFSNTRISSALGVTGIDLGYSDKPFGADRFYGNFNSWERTKTWMASLSQSLGQNTDASFGYRRHTDLFVLYRDRPQVYTNHHIAESWHASLRRRENLSPVATLHYGAEGFGDDVVSTNLGRHDRRRAAAYTLVDFRVLKRASFSAGMRAETYRGVSEWNPSLSAGFWAASSLKLRVAVSRAFRLPTYTDLYYRDPANRGDAGLRAEKAWSYEGGAEYRPHGAWRVQTTVFHRRDSDMIDYVRSPANAFWQAVNIQRLRYTGVESSVSVRKSGHIVDLSYTGMKGTSEPLPGLQSRYAFNYAVHNGILSWTGMLPGKLAVRSRAGVVERYGRGAYGLWEFSAARAMGWARPYVQFGNITNTRYEEIAGVVMPGRSVVGGVEMVWRNK